MTNEELKKKIIEIISPYVVERWHEHIADALIAAGLTFASEYKKLYEEEKAISQSLRGTSWQFKGWYEEQKHRAGVAERALRDRATYCAMEGMDYFSLTPVAIEARAKELYESWRREAEKELAEEKK